MTILYGSAETVIATCGSQGPQGVQGIQGEIGPVGTASLAISDAAGITQVRADIKGAIAVFVSSSTQLPVLDGLTAIRNFTASIGNLIPAGLGPEILTGTVLNCDSEWLEVSTNTFTTPLKNGANSLLYNGNNTTAGTHVFSYSVTGMTTGTIHVYSNYGGYNHVVVTGDASGSFSGSASNFQVIASAQWDGAISLSLKSGSTELLTNSRLWSCNVWKGDNSTGFSKVSGTLVSQNLVSNWRSTVSGTYCFSCSYTPASAVLSFNGGNLYFYTSNGPGIYYLRVSAPNYTIDIGNQSNEAIDSATFSLKFVTSSYIIKSYVDNLGSVVSSGGISLGGDISIASAPFIVGSKNSSNNVVVGVYAANSVNLSSSKNVIVGSSAGTYISGSNNVAIGFNAGTSNNAAGNTIVKRNVNSSNSIFIGANSKASGTTSTEEIVIGNNATGSGPYTTTIGNSSTILTKIYGETNITATKVFAKQTPGSAVYWEDTRLYDNAYWTLNDWTGDALSVGFIHAAGSTSSLIFNVAPDAGKTYSINVWGDDTVGSMTMSFGGITSYDYATYRDNGLPWVVTTVNNSLLTFTPSADFDATQFWPGPVVYDGVGYGLVINTSGTGWTGADILTVKREGTTISNLDYTGTLTIQGSIKALDGAIFKSPNNSLWKLTITDSGLLSSTLI